MTQTFKNDLKRIRVQRVQLEYSLRDQHWESPQALIIESFVNKSMASKVGSVPWLNQFLRKYSWTKWWFIRIPIIAIYLPILFLCALPILIFNIFFLTVKLVPIYIRFRRITSTELRNYDLRIQDEWAVIDRAKKQEEIDQQLRTEEFNRKKEYDLALSQAIWWRSEFQKSSSEKLLDLWALLQQFEYDHFIYFMLENSPGPILRKLVEDEVANRLISVEARQLVLLRLERKIADKSQADLIKLNADRARQDAQERHLEVVDSLMTVAMLQLFR